MPGTMQDDRLDDRAQQLTVMPAAAPRPAELTPPTMAPIVELEQRPPWHERHPRAVRVAIGLALVLHGLAHAAAGTWAAAAWPAWIVTPAWLVAMVGLVGAGFGAWGVAGLRRAWAPLAAAGATASIMMLNALNPLILVVGLVLDAVIVIAALELEPVIARAEPLFARPHRVRRALAATVAWSFLGWTTLAIALRPWHTSWGSTPAERAMALPGDDLVPRARYRMDHAIAIDAPVDAVWPWLVQIGQDRGGFYSYDWLERLVGDDVHNADRIHPEWQQLRAGDFVRATQQGYLGGAFGDEVGWPVAQVEPGRAIVLEGWGAFVLHPQPDGSTRLHTRLRGDGRPTLQGLVLGPVGLLGFEPAHFIMERGMMRGIRQRAERTVATGL